MSHQALPDIKPKKLDPLVRGDFKVDIEVLWAQNSIPEDLQVFYRELLFDPSAAHLLKKEVEDLRKGRSTIQLALKSVLAREESVASIEEMDSFLKRADNWTTLTQVKVECAELLHAHRILSLSTVETIVKWREHMAELNPSMPAPTFHWQGQNYMLKMRHDLDFLSNSDFAKAFKISPEPDPFLIVPSKSTSGNKPNPKAYFMDGDQVFIPMPSILMKRVLDAQQIVFDESPAFVSKEKPKPSKRIVKGIGHDLIDTVLSGICQEVASSFLGNQLQDKIFESLVNELVMVDCRQTLKEISSSFLKDQLQDKIFESLIDELVMADCRQTLKEISEEPSAKAKNLRDHQLCDMLYRLLLEEIIEETKVEELADGFLKRSIVKKRTTIKNSEEQARLLAQEIELENTKISKTIYEDILNEFMEDPWIKDLADFMISRESHRINTLPAAGIEAPEDNALEIFTPNVHSPVEYSLAEDSQLFGDSFQLEFELGLDLDNPNMNHLDFRPAKLPAIALSNDYMSFIPEDIREVDTDDIARDLMKGNNACWYWGLHSGKIIGMIVYYVDAYNYAERKLVLVHISCLSFKWYQEFLSKACAFLWKIDPCEEIRVNLYHPVTADINRAVRTVFNNLNFRWKAEQFIKEKALKLTVMGLKRPGQIDFTPKPPMKVQIGTILYASDTPVEANIATNDEMYSLGLRQNMINAILGLFGQLHKGKLIVDDRAKSLLQSEVTQIMKRINQEEFFDFPFTSSLKTRDLREAQDFIPLEVTQEALKSISVFNLEMNWVACTSIDYKVNYASYKYLCFQSEEIELLSDGEFEVFTVPTSVDLVKAFFIRGINIERGERDLFMYVQEILDSCQDDAGCTSFLAPAFSIDINTHVPWIEGYHLPPQNEEDQGCFISKCQEFIKLQMNPEKQADGILVYEVSKVFAIEGDFIFGMFHAKSHMPIFAVLVGKHNWISNF